jgi:hypothetical protein
MENNIEDKDIVFITSSLMTKWMNIQSKLIKHYFPNSRHIIINGSTNEFISKWPNSWFYFLYELQKCDEKFYVHIDEDFFLDSREELLKTFDKMEANNIDLMGVSDGNNHYRGANPVAINTFLMIGRVSDVKKIDVDRLSKAKYMYGSQNGVSGTWVNDLGIRYKEEYGLDYKYDFTKFGGCNYKVEQEPYYSFLWTLKEMGCKFDYLFPYFDDRFKSTNPRLEENSNDIGYHMWYTRSWSSQMDVHGMRNMDRYNYIEKYISEKYKL